MWYNKDVREGKVCSMAVKVKWKNIFRLFIVAFVMTSFAMLFNFNLKVTHKVEISLVGNDHLKLSINDTYVDEGVKLIIDNKEIDLNDVEYKVTSNVDDKATGSYEVDYEIVYNDNTYKIKRYVEVLDDIAPTLTISQEYATQYKCKNTNKFNLDYIAEDNYDGIITDKVKVSIEDDKVILTVKDSANNVTTKEVPLKIIDDASIEVIELNGRDIIYIPVGGDYTDEGAILKDGCGKEANASLEVINEVDNEIPGEYMITYQYINDNDEVIKKIRKVIVYQESSSNYLKEEDEKIVYLTFDDGPGQYTEELLDILKKYDVKATFFVTNQFKKYVPLIKREYEEGHTVAVHSLTHKWSIYQSVETYLKDFNDMNDIVYKYTGSKTKIFRFPGGSSNTISRSYAKGVVGAIASKMTENGYVYFDWNVDSNDAAGAKSDAIYKNVIEGISKRNSSVVLMHDIKRGTIDVIEDIIKYGLDNGYTFKTLTVSSPTVHHNINN